MRPFGTAERWLGLFLLLALPAAVQAQVIHDTGPVELEVFDNGFLGAGANVPGSGFVFNGQNGLFEGQLLVGLSTTQVSGEAYADSVAGGQGPFEWVALSGPDGIPGPGIAPYDEFDTGYSAVYDDSGAPNPIGLEVVQNSYSTTDAGDNTYVVTAFTIHNVSAATLTGVYVGLFADFDVGTAFATNLAGYNATNRLLYVWDPSAGNPGYYGMAALGGAAVSGWEFDVGAGSNPGEDDLYNAMTNGGIPDPTTGADRRTVLGTGPYTLRANESVVVAFAFVAGSSLAAITANAAAARTAVPATNVVTALAPVNPPVGVPGGGGSFGYSATIRNASGSAQTFQAWVTGTLPNGVVYFQKAAGPVSVTLPPGASITRKLSVQVPGVAPSGTYALTLRVGTHPGTTVHSSSFTFTKPGPEALAGGDVPGDFLLAQGDFFAADAGVSGPAPGVAASPNPFTAATTIRYEVAEARPVRLAVYDVLGREVAVLVDGAVEAGAHEAVFDARDLAAGVYVVRLTAGTQVQTQRITLTR
jgi:hypothetical protein